MSEQNVEGFVKITIIMHIFLIDKKKKEFNLPRIPLNSNKNSLILLHQDDASEKKRERETRLFFSLNEFTQPTRRIIVEMKVNFFSAFFTFVVLFSIYSTTWVDEIFSFRINYDYNLYRYSNVILHMCSEVKKDPTFRGDCLENKGPTSEEYEDFYAENKSKSSSTMRTIENESINLEILTGRISCPRGYMPNKRGKCKLVIIKL